MFDRWHAAADRWPSTAGAFSDSGLLVLIASMKLRKWALSSPPAKRWISSPFGVNAIALL